MSMKTKRHSVNQNASSDEWASVAKPKDVQTLNAMEQTSIRALVSYVAYTHGLEEDVVRGFVQTRFHADDVKNISSADYDNAVAYLVDFDPRQAALQREPTASQNEPPPEGHE
ncbi:MAG: hypothetical protein PHS57_09145 [Alphaproteobacteria bacterium]|nr:hypothetical protein [Alphaproteobacteria bacterium]